MTERAANHGVRASGSLARAPRPAPPPALARSRAHRRCRVRLDWGAGEARRDRGTPADFWNPGPGTMAFEMGAALTSREGKPEAQEGHGYRHTAGRSLHPATLCL